MVLAFCDNNPQLVGMENDTTTAQIAQLAELTDEELLAQGRSFMAEYMATGIREYRDSADTCARMLRARHATLPRN